jgi:hypothetical protein
VPGTLLEQLCAEAGCEPQTLDAKPWGRAVIPDAEFLRIRALPRRDWPDVLPLELGSRPLFPVQRAALADLAATRHLCMFANVGVGKLLVGALAPVVLGTRVNLLITYAQLLDKTKREIAEASKHWRCNPDDFTYVSAERLVRSELLARPWDLIVVDEAHLFRPGSQRSKAFEAYLKRHPGTSVVLLTGTPGDDDIRDVAFLSKLAHGPTHSPYPTRWHALDQWHRALSERVDDRLEAGCLTEFVGPAPANDVSLDDVRLAVAEHAARTPGHLVYRPAQTVSCSLYLSSHTLRRPTSRALERAYESTRLHGHLGDYDFAELPAERWRLLRQLGLGYAKIIDPRPPAEWILARRLWASICAAYVGTHYENVAQLCAAAAEPSHALNTSMNAWRAIEPSFKPAHKVLWYDDVVVRWCVEWLQTTKGLLWTPYPDFGEKVSLEAGVPFFHRLGVCSRYGSIESYGSHTGAVLSIQANSTGRNLQRWSQSLVVAPPAKSDSLNQLIGRTHRTGQNAEQVNATFLFSCGQHIDAVERALERAKFDASLGGNQGNKLLDCDWLVDTTRPKGPLWRS